jgi:hypothetical protein
MAKLFLPVTGEWEMLKLTVAHCKNPDIGGGYWDDPAESGKARVIEVQTIEGACLAFREYIGLNRLGGGNIPRNAGKVRENGKLIGRVAYNGRFFRADDTECVFNRF